ncbi:MAG: prolyl oligopeptidase family serine peptidase [Actinomycetota bacterium]
MLTEEEREFPRRYARTGRFTNGSPRAITVAPDGSRVVFLRSSGPEDDANALWVLDVDGFRERSIADPRELGADADDLPAVERARRERVRESAGGIVAYACDDAVSVATFAAGATLFLADLGSGETRRLSAEPPVFDPRPDPTGSRVAYVAGGALHLVDVAGGVDRILAADPDPDVSWGSAEFAAAEEMGRIRGFWFSPDGERIAACRVDERRVPVWFIADPTDPSAAPAIVRYPVAGSTNADVSLALFDVADGARLPVQWDREEFPYLARVSWTPSAPLTLLVQSRDQRVTQVLEVDAATGRTALVREDRDHAWVDLVPGSPARLTDGRLVSTVDADDTRRLAIDGSPVTPPGLQVRSIVRASDTIVITASTDPYETHLYRVTPGDAGPPEPLTTASGVHWGSTGGDTLVALSRTLEDDRTRAEVWRDGARIGVIGSSAEPPPLDTRPSFSLLGTRELRSALLIPRDVQPDRSGPLPVLLDPYGGPHHARVVHARQDFHGSQWFADRGFAVLVTDGRGTPGRGPAWERGVRADLAGPVLEDQVDALAAAAVRYPGLLDLDRVAIRGWSFGGFLAALAVLERPDIVHAAVAGAPVTDWALYDTHYTERYLGSPKDDPEAYGRSSLVRLAGRLERPLLLLHGLADDNVVVAHTLRLSTALFEHGKHHEMVLLPNATHMTRSEVVVERRFDLELDFLRRSLGLVEGVRSSS